LKILFDTNVVLDVILKREPFVTTAVMLMSAVEERRMTGVLCATTLTTIDYLVSKAKDTYQARATVKKLLMLFEVAAVDSPVLQTAAESGFTDFEDAVLYFAGKRAGVGGIVTRKQDDFTAVELPIYQPDELLAISGLFRIHEQAAAYGRG
jgi:predicted nucleic acid-binding protein